MHVTLHASRFKAGMLVVLVLILVLLLETGVAGAISAWAGATFLAAVVSFLLVHRLTEIRWSFHLPAFKDTVKFGIRVYLGNVIQLLNFRLDMILVGFFVGITAVGYYSVSVALAEALWLFSSAVAMMVYAQTSGVTREQANKLTPVICRNTLLITFLGALLLFALGKIIITLIFGAAFLPALQPLWVLLPGIVTFSVCCVLANELAGRGKPIIVTIMAAISLAVNIPLNLLLIPRWGITGAAFASTIAYTIAALVTLIAFVRESKTNWFDIIIPRRQELKIYLNLLSTVRKSNLRQIVQALRS